MVKFHKPLLSFVTLLSLVTIFSTALALPLEGNHVPIVSVNSLSVGPNSSTTITIGLGGTASTDRVITLSSNSQYLSVPSSVTVPAGESSATVTATTGSFTGTSVARVTVTYGSVSTYTDITLQ